MEVILLEQIKKLGKLGDKIKVKDGFARNFLFPRNKAVLATPQNIKMFEAQRADVEAVNKANIVKAREIAEKIEGCKIVIISQAGDDNRLYGSVNVRDIAAKISSEQGVEVIASHILLDGKVKELGIYNITVELHPEVSINVMLNIARSEEEARMNFDQHNQKAIMKDESKNRKARAAQSETSSTSANSVAENIESTASSVTVDEAEDKVVTN